MSGQDLVTQVDASRWAHNEFLHPDKTNPATSYTFAAGSLGDISAFDAGFFNISPREAMVMDPQQRMLLEMCWETFENAGIKPSSLRGSNCGVYLGIGGVEQSYRLVEDLASIDAATATGNTSSIAANRLSFFYDLRGPSMAIDTACSSSLVAFHQACQAIISGDIDQALTGGISLHMHPFGFMIFAKASMLSRTGRCHAFDQSGDGYARSEGGGLFLLKDYEQELADGNPILAVVAGSAVNTDGRKSSLTLPSAEAQAALLKSTYAKAGIDPSQWTSLEDMWADQKKVEDAGFTFIAIGGNTFQAGYTFHALLAANALVIGAGGLGSPAALYLGSAGVGHITVVDPDRVDTTNLQRQNGPISLRNWRRRRRSDMVRMSEDIEEVLLNTGNLLAFGSIWRDWIVMDGVLFTKLKHRVPMLFVEYCISDSAEA